MKKPLLFLVFCFLLISPKINAQSPGKGSNSLASFDIHLPVGVFARSQFAGTGLNYSWSHHRFGINSPAKRLIGFTINAGGNYYFGRKIKISEYDFHYGGYTSSYIMAGLLFNPWANGNISLTAGPTMEIYKGNSDFGFGVNLFGSYYLSENVSIGPGITYTKYAETDQLWALAFRVSYSF